MEGRIHKPRSHKLRIGRRSIPNHIYLITTVTHQRKPIFDDLYLGRLLAQSLHEYSPVAHTLCYVIMPDHLHWLMSLGESKTLSQIVGGMKKHSARKINRRLGTKGKLWQNGFHDRAIRREEDIRAIARYVVANPLRAGLVDSIEDYSLWDAVWL